MIEGSVTDDGVPQIELMISGSTWTAVVDTGFNGDLELPMQLQESVHAEHLGSIVSSLAGGQSITEENYDVQIPFDGQTVHAQATFVDADEVLIGTRLLRDYRLFIDFPAGTVILERMTTSPDGTEFP